MVGRGLFPIRRFARYELSELRDSRRTLVDLHRGDPGRGFGVYGVARSIAVCFEAHAGSTVRFVDHRLADFCVAEGFAGRAV